MPWATALSNSQHNPRRFQQVCESTLLYDTERVKSANVGDDGVQYGLFDEAVHLNT